MYEPDFIVDHISVEEFPTDHGTIHFRIEGPTRWYWYRDGLIMYAPKEDDYKITMEVIGHQVRKDVIYIIKLETGYDVPFYPSNKSALEAKQ